MQFSKQSAAMDVEKYKQYTQDQQITTMQLVDVTYHSTLCSTCETVCHHMCSLTEIATPGRFCQYLLKADWTSMLTNVEVSCRRSSIWFMCLHEWGTCTKCGCGISTHYHARKIYQEVC